MSVSDRSRRAMQRRRAPRWPWTLALLCLAAAAPGCASPPSHFTRLWPEGQTGVALTGLSTEDGVLVFAAPDFEVGQIFEIQFPVGNSLVRDWGRIDRLNDTFAVIHPITARLKEGRVATELPKPGEQIYLALRDVQDKQVMLKVDQWQNGAAGDWVVLPRRDPTQIA